MSREEKLDPLAIISKLAAAEQELKGKVFLAPVLKNARCEYALRELYAELQVQTDFQGWHCCKRQIKVELNLSNRQRPLLWENICASFARADGARATVWRSMVGGDSFYQRYALAVKCTGTGAPGWRGPEFRYCQHAL